MLAFSLEPDPDRIRNSATRPAETIGWRTAKRLRVCRSDGHEVRSSLLGFLRERALFRLAASRPSSIGTALSRRTMLRSTELTDPFVDLADAGAGNLLAQICRIALRLDRALPFTPPGWAEPGSCRSIPRARWPVRRSGRRCRGKRRGG